MYRNFFKKTFSHSFETFFSKTYQKFKPRTNPLLSLTIGTFAIFHTKKYFMADDT